MQSVCVHMYVNCIMSMRRVVHVCVINYKLCNQTMPTHTGIHKGPPPKKCYYLRVRVTDLVVFIQPTHAWWHLVHNSNLGCELVLHQIGCQVPTHKPNTCSEQTDNQTGEQTNMQMDRRTDAQTDRQTNMQTNRQTNRHNIVHRTVHT